MTLVVESLSVQRAGHPLLADVSLAVAPGEVLAVIGANGAGKSTLLQALAGDLAPTAGSICFDARPLAGYPRRQRAQRLAFLPQASPLAFPFTVAEVVALGRSPHASGRRQDAEIVAAACALTDIEHLRARPYTRLSGGERQRVQLARVLAQVWREDDSERPRLLLLDEPVAALDLGHQQALMRTLAAFARGGAAVVMVLHDVSLAARHADRVVALAGGRVWAAGPPRAVVTAAALRRLFGVEATVVAHPDTGAPVILPS